MSLLKDILACGSAGAILISILVFSLSATFPNSSLLPGALTGVHVTHNGSPISELFVDVSCFGCLGHNTVLTGSTDNNGVFTFHAAYAADSSYTFIYKVTFGGQTYGIIGHAGSIVEDPI
jgi:hypothetical protein